MAWNRRLLALPVAIMAAGSAATAAQDNPGRNCTDDRGVDRCTAAQHREVLELFGMQPIEAHEASGDQVRRVFYVDGYGRDLVAIAFVRAAGRDPMLSVHFPRREGESPREPLTAMVPQRVWEDLLFRSQMFDRELAPPASSPSRPVVEAVPICLHSWVYTVEAADPASPADFRRAMIRRKVEDACQEGLAEVFAVEAQRAALPLLPACASLDPDQHRNPASILAACAMLHGDRMAAAAVMNRALALRRAHGPDDLIRIEGLFDYRGSVDWNGERAGGENNEAARFWLAKLGERDQTNFYIDRLEGESAYRVRVAGSLVRPVEGNTSGNGPYERATVEQIWSYGPGREFQIETATVGPFVVITYD
jgi:hypothetical protein